MQKKYIAIVSVAVSVAVMAVAVLVLFLTGVISVNEDVEGKEYKKLCKFGEFYCTDLDTGITDYSSTFYFFKADISDGGSYAVFKLVPHNPYGLGETSYMFYLYYADGTRRSEAVAIDEHRRTINTEDDNVVYDQFLDWCRENGTTPKEIMKALDYYHEQEG